MKHLYLAVAVAAIFGLSLTAPAIADEQSSSSEVYDQDYYSPPLGGEGCSTPVHEKPIS